MVKMGKFNFVVKNNCPSGDIICKETGKTIASIKQHARRVKGTFRSPFRDAQGYYTLHVYYTLNYYTLNGDDSKEYTTRKAAVIEAASGYIGGQN